MPAHPGALAHTFSLFCQNSVPSSPSCPQFHLLLLSEADAVPQPPPAFPESLQLSIPEGAGSGVHTSKKSQLGSMLTREAREKSHGPVYAVGKLHGKWERFSANPTALRSGRRFDTYLISLFIQTFCFWDSVLGVREWLRWVNGLVKCLFGSMCYISF